MRVASVLLLASLGCAAATSGPRGPLSGRGLDIATDFSYAFGRGDVALSDGTVAHGGADNFWSDLTIIPRRLEARLSPVSWMDVGAQLGWLGGGVDARLGRPAADDRVLAFQLAGGLESGQPGPFVDTRVLRSRWARLEAYPLLAGRHGGRRTRLVLAAGLHAGTFYHQLSDPRPDPAIDGISPHWIGVVREETRIETALGFQVASPRSETPSAATVMFAVEPYWVTNAKPALMDCRGCDPVTSYQQSWGVVFVLRLAAQFRFLDPR